MGMFCGIGVPLPLPLSFRFQQQHVTAVVAGVAVPVNRHAATFIVADRMELGSGINRRTANDMITSAAAYGHFASQRQVGELRTVARAQAKIGRSRRRVTRARATVRQRNIRATSTVDVCAADSDGSRKISAPCGIDGIPALCSPSLEGLVPSLICGSS